MFYGDWENGETYELLAVQTLTKPDSPRIMMKLIILSTSLRRCMKHTAGAIKRQADR